MKRKRHRRRKWLSSACALAPSRLCCRGQGCAPARLPAPSDGPDTPRRGAALSGRKCHPRCCRRRMLSSLLRDARLPRASRVAARALTDRGPLLLDFDRVVRRVTLRDAQPGQAQGAGQQAAAGESGSGPQSLWLRGGCRGCCKRTHRKHICTTTYPPVCMVPLPERGIRILAPAHRVLEYTSFEYCRGCEV